MGMKFAAALPTLAERLTRTTIERFVDLSLTTGKGVVSGLVPSIRANSLTIDYTGGSAYVNSVLYSLGAGTFLCTASQTRYFWMDAAGAFQSGTAWPGTAHCKLFGVISDASYAYKILVAPWTEREILKGYNPTRQGLVIAQAANPGAGTTLYQNPYSAQYPLYLHGYGLLIDVKRPFLVTQCSMLARTSTTAKTYRIGLWDRDVGAWAINPFGVNLYADVAIGTFTSVDTWLSANFSSVLIYPGHYILGCVPLPLSTPSLTLTPYNTNAVQTFGGAYMDEDWELLSLANDRASAAWNPSTQAFSGRDDQPQQAYRTGWRITGRDADFAQYQINQTLAAQPARFLASMNARRRNISSGAYSAQVVASQPTWFTVSLDGGSHKTSVVEGNELSTPYTGTALQLECLGLNDHADELEITDLGFFYET